MVADTEKDRLVALEADIAALRAARAPKRSAGADKFNAASLAWRMVTELVVGVLLGAAIGWGLDSVTGMLPLFLILFTLLGFAAGVRVMIRSGDEVTRRGALEAAAGGDGARSAAGGEERLPAAGGDATKPAAGGDRTRG
ncbi:MAG: F0F1 ATP synthase subunit I [Rhodobacterales bacterium CG_4_9_14_3_um_filter_71_31]|nr:MAG: F0F1 ATP synthase subunit I [Rhodobacterales bacterium CG_4_9_14_3_um_filter_71_31]